MNHAAESVGLIGVGLLGTALAERLLAGGFAVFGHDVSEERLRKLRKLGGEPASAREVAGRCRRVVLCLPDSDAVEAVLGEIDAELRPGQVILDTTTGDPERTVATGDRLAARSVSYLDACVLGSSELARAGEAVVMVGGEVGDNADLLGCLSREWFHAGPCGAGGRMKLVVNLVLGLNRAALAEGLSLAKSSGLDPAAALQVLRAGAAYSRVMDTKGEKMLRRDFRPEAWLRQHLKDVRLILDQAARAGARVPLSEAHRELLERVVALGGGDDDNSAVIRAYDPEVNPS
jgi:3-hydroxyisobutyrate dehydrogenase-like beta-hydroxyacid dehydrogenase